MITIKLPRKHAEDWMDRCGEDMGAEVIQLTARTITIQMSPEALADLKDDAQYFADSMKGDWTGGIDYSAAATRCLAAIKRAGY